MNIMKLHKIVSEQRSERFLKENQMGGVGGERLRTERSEVYLPPIIR